jgi:lipoyl(octanoyl) transferase
MRWFRLACRFAALAVLFAGSVAVAAERTQLLVYSTLEPDFVGELKKAFEADNPDIEIVWQRDSTGVITARLLAERGERGDAIWGLAATSMMRLKKEALLKPHAPPNLAEIRPNFRDAETPPAWVGMEAWAAAVCFNTAEAEKLGLPKPASWYDLLDPRFPMFATGRGGQLTYHGPGQRVAYVMLDLKRRRPDVRAYVAGLEEWIIRTLAAFNVRGERREDRVGVWVKRPDKGAGFEDKIAAIGVRLRRWVSFHGIAINVEPELSHFSAIVPCGVVDPRYGVTSLVDLGLPVTMEDVDVALRQAFAEVFGDTKMLLPETTI